MMVWSMPCQTWHGIDQQMLLQFTTLVYIKSTAIYKEDLAGTEN